MDEIEIKGVKRSVVSSPSFLFGSRTLQCRQEHQESSSYHLQSPSPALTHRVKLSFLFLCHFSFLYTYLPLPSSPAALTRALAVEPH